MSLVTFSKLTLSRMDVWPTRRIRFGSSLKALTSFSSPLTRPGFRPGRHLRWRLDRSLFGHPWFGVWLSAGLLAAALCWALQGWLPPGWALFGAFIGLDLCLFSYWMNSYWGGAVTAIGGALVTGAWIRITRAKQWRYAWVLGIGAVIVVLSRPFEGLLLLVPTLIALGLANRSGARVVTDRADWRCGRFVVCL